MFTRQLVLAASCFAVFHIAFSATYSDRKCGDDLGHLWLDVVLIVDNSRAVTNIDQVARSILNVFGNDTRIGTRVEEPRTTRIGMVTYNQIGEVIADLNLYQSFADLSNSISEHLSNVSSSPDSSLLSGLQTAESVLDKSVRSGERATYKKVFIIYTPVLTGVLTSIPLADRLKADGVTIVTVDVSGDENRPYSKGLEEVATRNYDFGIGDENLTGKIQNALLQTNCFCPNTWTQLRDSLSDHHSYRYGTCLTLNTLPAVWRAARLSCRNQWRNSHLASENDLDKHDYVLEMMKVSPVTLRPYSYHIGLTYSSGEWYWEQAEGMPLKRVDWNNWKTGFPLVLSQKTVGMNVDTGEVVEWQNTEPMGAALYYVCEVATCDTDTYCDTLDF